MSSFLTPPLTSDITQILAINSNNDPGKKYVKENIRLSKNN